MLYLLLWVGSLQQILCLFAPHMDLQKIDEIMFDDAKYNVLKPTVHITRDHFKDFIQERDTKDFPGRKLYVDKNGIRHYWDGFEARRPESLRKTNDMLGKENKISVDEEPINGNQQGNTINKELTNVTNKPELKKGKKKPLRKKKVIEPSGVVPLNKLALRNDNGKTKVKTTFFCPFFGVITMVSNINQ